MIFRNKKKRSRQTDQERLLPNLPPNSRFAESYRTLRTNLFFSNMDNEIKSIMVTSSVEKEGKTTTTLNLAHSIAQTDRKVLAIDCDLRRPQLSSLMTETPGAGVTELVTEIFGTHLTKGSLDKFGVDDLIQLTRLQNRSTRLYLANNEIQAEILFEKGKITNISWINRPKSKHVVTTLIRENLISEEQARLVLNKQKKSGRDLAFVLSTMDLVPKKDLTRALSIHIVEAIRAVSAMETGSFEFSTLPRDSGKSAKSQTIDIEKLFENFNNSENALKYCNAAIDTAIAPTKEDNLFVIYTGKIPPNPAEVVGSNHMAFLIEILKSRFDFILIDTPPVTAATDALLFTPMVDGTLLVIKSGNTDRKIIQNVVDQFKAVNQPILGFVLNQVDMKKEGYYKYYEKYYSSYYGNK
ncbi:polysaccharide biosynthesis tyrosine autokinase [Desulfobacter latus]|uniref:Polysaccharide biosynthesis tyrosine autokinase n=1 Tax=Desulfobacter latus TaxID=2292 RepID=A0A850SW39_9BACT|nr:polysaccharide biosynthesis tyrosine autokinase [Desulfobacter latus]NWH04310.1 polysaccharide biosynthesis tyrosine autokinase [Desulfobacter latus]